jgi:predicted dehydrogenase
MTELIASGTLGEVTDITSAFTSMSDMTENYRLHPEMGGGALLDVGCYQVHAWAALTGGAGVCALAGVHRELGESGVDLTTEVAAVVNGATAVRATSSFDLPASQELEVRGSLGKVHMGEGEAFSSWNEATTLVLNGEVEHFAPVNAFEVMVNNVSQLIMGESGWRVSPEQSVRVAEILGDIQSF